MEYRNIIFDFDGTLADTAAFIVEVMHRTIQVLHLPERNDAECRSTIGYRLEEVPTRLWPEAPDLSEQYAKTYREVFNSLKGGFKVKLYPNVRETLSTLHHNGVNMGQRIFPVGGGDVRSIVLSLQNETRPTAKSHIARCVDRQLRH